MKTRQQTLQSEIKWFTLNVEILKTDLCGDVGKIDIPIHPPDYMRGYTILSTQILDLKGLPTGYKLVAEPNNTAVQLKVIRDSAFYQIDTYDSFTVLILVAEYPATLILGE